MLNSSPYEITRVDSLQWNRTANIRVMKEMIGSCDQTVSAEAGSISEDVLADVKKAIMEEITKEKNS